MEMWMGGVPTKCTVRVTAMGEAEIIGLRCGSLRVHERRQGLLVLYEHGYTSYVDRMTGRKYSPAGFRVYRVLKSEEGSDGVELLRVEEMIDFPAKVRK